MFRALRGCLGCWDTALPPWAVPGGEGSGKNGQRRCMAFIHINALVAIPCGFLPVEGLCHPSPLKSPCLLPAISPPLPPAVQAHPRPFLRAGSGGAGATQQGVPRPGPPHPLRVSSLRSLLAGIAGLIWDTQNDGAPRCCADRPLAACVCTLPPRCVAFLQRRIVRGGDVHNRHLNGSARQRCPGGGAAHPSAPCRRCALCRQFGSLPLLLW